jgi:ABC-type dipeptide/oligopeptide/nickel transport system ATPase subunit
VRLHAVAPAPAMSIVEVRNVSMAFDTGANRHAVFEDISFDVDLGSFLCIVGTSGCGKTTLLRQIAGLQKPTSGSVIFNGAPVTRPTQDKAIVFQDYSKALLPWRTAPIASTPAKSKSNISVSTRPCGRTGTSRSRTKTSSCTST